MRTSISSLLTFSLDRRYNYTCNTSRLSCKRYNLRPYNFVEETFTMYQQITLIGNLGADPEMRYTPNGLPVTSFRMAVSRNWTGQDGQRQEKTVWFRVTAWRKLAETASQY